MDSKNTTSRRVSLNNFETNIFTQADLCKRVLSENNQPIEPNKSNFYLKTKDVNFLFDEIEKNKYFLNESKNSNDFIDLESEIEKDNQKVPESSVTNSKLKLENLSKYNNCTAANDENKFRNKNCYNKPKESRFVKLLETTLTGHDELENQMTILPELQFKNEFSDMNLINYSRKEMVGNKITNNNGNISKTPLKTFTKVDSSLSNNTNIIKNNHNNSNTIKSENDNNKVRGDLNNINSKSTYLNKDQQLYYSSINSKDTENIYYNQPTKMNNNTKQNQHPVIDLNYTTSSSVQSATNLETNYFAGNHGYGYQPWNNYVQLPPFIPLIQSNMVSPDIYLQLCGYNTEIDSNHPAYFLDVPSSSFLLPNNINTIYNNNINNNINNNSTINNNNIKTQSTKLNSESIFKSNEKIVENVAKEITTKKKSLKNLKNKFKRSSKEEIERERKSIKFNLFKETTAKEDSKNINAKSNKFSIEKFRTKKSNSNKEQYKDTGLGISYINSNDYGFSNSNHNQNRSVGYSKKKSKANIRKTIIKNRIDTDDLDYFDDQDSIQNIINTNDRDNNNNQVKESSLINELLKKSNKELCKFLQTKSGSKTMQNSIKNISKSQESNSSSLVLVLDNIVSKLLSFDFTELIMSSYSSFFFEKSVHYFTYKYRKALISSEYFKANFVKMCCGKYSNIVIQSFMKCLSGNIDEEQEENIFYKLIYSNLLSLIPDQYANFVLSQAFFCFKHENKKFLFEFIHKNLVDLSIDTQYGHYLVKNFIKYFSIEKGSESIYKCCQAKYPESVDFIKKQRVLLVQEVLEELETLAVHKYGHFVVVDLIELWGLEICSEIISKFANSIQVYWKIVYGYSITKRIFLVNYLNEVSLYL
jgi:hypothetical protein